MNLTVRSRLLDALLRRDRVEQAPVLLDRRRIYILPTRHGLAFALTLLLLLIGSINYGLSLGFLLTFLLTATAVVGMLHTFRNLEGISVRWLRPEPVYAGGQAVFPLLLETVQPTPRMSLTLRAGAAVVQTVDTRDGSALVHLSVPAGKRGLLPMPRLKIETRYPLGLFRAWSWLRPEVKCVVYPAPAPPDLPLPLATADGHAGPAAATVGNDEFANLRAYQAGDSPRRIAWRAYARERGLLTKQFHGEESGDFWIDWYAAPEADDEAKLSRLARWVLDAEALGVAYGLRIPGATIAPAQGDAHRHACLTALALCKL